MKKQSESKKDKLIGFIKHQIDFDITPFISNKSKRKYIIIDTYKMPESVKRNINSLAHQFKKFSVAPNGVHAVALLYSDSL